MIWRCPRCRGGLIPVEERLRCEGCGSSYETIGGIPDLRVEGPSWVDYERDRAEARRLLVETPGLSGAELVRWVYASRQGWDEALISLRAEQVISAVDRLRVHSAGWLRPCVKVATPFLDLGCGPGALLAAAAAEGWSGIGLDVSLTWLLVAQRLIAEWGGRPTLAAGLAEALPLATGSVSSVIALDVIEHVADPSALLEEVNRVTAPEGSVALTTPNRYSLAAEPHVFVWGVGWLPRPLQGRFVQWRSGKSYQFTQLLSTRELRRLIRQHTDFRVDVVAPPVPDDEMARFSTRRAVLARAYNQLSARRWAQPLLLSVGPSLRIVGRKDGGGRGSAVNALLAGAAPNRASNSRVVTSSFEDGIG